MKKALPYLSMAAVATLLAFLAKDSLRPFPPPQLVTPAAPSAVPQPAGSPGAKVVTSRDGATLDLGRPPGPGKVRVLHFWATWCPPCVEELPGLLAWARENGRDSRLELVTVSVDDDWKVVDPWLAKHGGKDLPVWLDRGKGAAASFGTVKFPETHLIGPDGQVLSQVRGPMDWSSPDVRAQLATLLASAGPASPRG